MKKLFLSLLGAAVLVLAVVVWWLKQERSSPVQLPESKQEKLSLSEWLSSSRGVECKLKLQNQETTVFVKGNKLKVLGQTVSMGGRMEKGGMVSDGQWVYIWESGEKQGVKYREEQVEEGKEQLLPLAKMRARLKAAKEYDCHYKEMSEEELLPPKEVEFVEMKAIFNQTEE